MDAARLRFEEALRLSLKLESEPARTMAHAFIFGNRAYFEHKAGDNHIARRTAYRSLDADLSLEQGFDLSMYQIHRIQLGRNLARLCWKEGRAARAFSLCGSMIGFLEGSSSSPPYHHSWRPRALLGVPRLLLKGMIVQISVEALASLAFYGSAASWRHFLAGVHLPSTRQEVRHIPAGPWLWWRAKRAQLAGDLYEYLDRLTEILPDGPSKLGTFFYLMLADLINVCIHTGSPTASRIREVLLKDSHKWRGVPPLLSERFRELAA